MFVSFVLLCAQFILMVASGLVLIFAFSCLPGEVPYLPSKRLAIDTALDELDLLPGDVFYDIGSGDGRIVLEAARRQPHALCIGLEKSFGWSHIARYYWWRHGRPSNVRFVRGDFHTKSFADATKIYTFLCTSVMNSLGPKLESELKHCMLVSSDFPLPHKNTQKTIELETSSRDIVSRTLYIYKFE